VYIEIPNVERAQLPGWIGMRLSSQGQSADRTALDFIADRVEGNLLAAHQEIQKLGLLHEPGKLSFEQVQDAVLNVARYDVFKLSEAMLAGDPARLARMLEGLKGEGEALPLVLWAVSEEIRTLLKLKAGMAQGRPLGALLKEYRIWGPRERMMDPALAAHLAGHAGRRRCRRRRRSTRWSRACAPRPLRAMPGMRCCSWP
jgi:DNA polymerase-3 subunit delta